MNWFQNCMPVDCLVVHLVQKIQGLHESPFLKIKRKAMKLYDCAVGI